MSCKRIQCDEIWSFVGAKEANVPPNQQGQFGRGDVYTWVALDSDSKLVISWLVGTRGAAYAKAFMKDVASRLTHRVQLTTDGHKGYLSAVEGAFGIGGAPATAIRVVIAAASLAIAFRLRHTPGLALAAGALGSLLVVPYLHGSDLCLFSVAAWIVWEELTTLRWRIPVAAGWLLSTPYINSTGLALRLNRWTLFEVVLLIALGVAAFWRGREPSRRLASASQS